MAIEQTSTSGSQIMGGGLIMNINGYDVTATFAKQKNVGIYEKVRQILLSSYVGTEKNHCGDKLDTTTKA